MADDAGDSKDTRFVGPIPDLYQRLLVPMIFRAAADSLAQVVAGLSPHDVLETAAGTGALTRALVKACPDAAVTATDLNQPMLDAAATHTADGATVTFQQADALDLPFGDQTFDVVACQFGVMFFPDRVHGYREAGRVLRPDGSFVFNTWDRIENNEVTHVIQSALVAAAPDEPLLFMSRTPHGYFSPEQIRADLEAAGMPGASITAIDGTSRTSASEAATAFCQGTPLRVAIESHTTLSVAEATAIAEDALLQHFGAGPIDAPIRSFEVVARPTAPQLTDGER
ncbi:class I SAM-dependent methyltransferase [Aeromicrobium stalagmiti]|uniref:class I SAM-dependent methyltransferase n=1 Tax=Aeromicrobium stalagmiti TaxID=2738988 RepID=UPI0015681885|nr:class I SAM-dependent methyltransferase [Aeromicrobium stalagmiti]NRQ51463.1 methyltransferase domain-containing protein [Aeromicrobium stalagmiti]